MTQLFRRRAEKVILDIGCGRNPWMLRSRAEGFAKCIGIDPEVEPLCDGNITLMKGSAYALPLADNSVDVVTSVNVLEHLEHPRKAFAECKRVLRPNGLLLLITPNKLFPPLFAAQSIPHQLRQKLLKMLLGRDEDTVYPAYYRANTSRTLRKMLISTGFSVLSTEHVSEQPIYFEFSATCYCLWTLFDRFCLRHKPFWRLRHYIVCKGALAS